VLRIFLFITGGYVNVLLASDGANDGGVIFILLKNSPPGRNYVQLLANHTPIGVVFQYFFHAGNQPLAARAEAFFLRVLELPRKETLFPVYGEIYNQ
jgi:hypothetical protein